MSSQIWQLQLTTFVPNVTSMEAPFFLMFGRDPYMPLNQLMAQARRYLGTEEGYTRLRSSTKSAPNDNGTQIQYAAKQKEPKLQTCEAT